MQAQKIDDSSNRKRHVIELLQPRIKIDHYTTARINAFNSQLVTVASEIQRLSNIIDEYRHVLEIITGSESLRIVSIELQDRINSEFETILNGIRRFERLYPLRDKT